MSRSTKEPFAIGDLVVSDYRVPPFLTAEILVVKGLSNVGKKTKPHWRVFVGSVHRAGIEGWLDADTLKRLSDSDVDE
jgi:hypothetical protein